ncbi:glycosyltransferase family 1 protein [Mammaliicoccus sciuri]|uniref:glycosyltransferase family 1 protein n=1 Tax=Mammaliicoccus sciuri TaxID=1296 RepID=UPI0019503322|nr:glycosyltransferase [Mammaliicoccus sciuri]MEB6197757.1 glycosyltransferase [Mammaliicoccus sciuri]
MNILSIGHSQSGGGLQTVFRISNKIYDKDINIITAFKSDKENKADIELKRIKDYNNIFAKIVGYFFIGKNYHSIKEVLIKNDVDIIHLHSTTGLSLSLLFALRKYKKDSKLIFSSHGYGLVCPNYSCYNYSQNKICTECVFKGKESRVIFKKCDKRGYVYSFLRYLDFRLQNLVTKNNKMFDTVITPSNYLKSLLENSKHNFKDIQIISNPIESIGNNNIFKENIISYVGRFSKEKNVDLLIKSFSELIQIDGYENVKLQVLGSGSELNNYKKIIKELSIENRVFISDKFLNKEELENKLKHSKIMVLPTGSPETFGLVIFEGIKYNMIPVTYNIGAQFENIKKLNVGEIFTEMNSTNILKSLIQALEKYDYSHQRLQKANTLIDKKYSVEEYHNNLKKLYKNVLQVH